MLLCKVSATNKWLHSSSVFALSCTPTLWSCCTIDPSLAADKIALLACMRASLRAWAVIFLTTFFQFLKGLVTHTPPVHRKDFPNCLQVLQKAPSLSLSYSNQLNSLSQLLEHFLLPDTEWCLKCFFALAGSVGCFFEGGSWSEVELSESSSLLLLQLSTWAEEALGPYQEQIISRMKYN